MNAEFQYKSEPHVPVMLAEVLAQLEPKDGGIYVDGTFGAGGYSCSILNKAQCIVYAIDRDPDAIRAGQALVPEFGGRLTLIEGRFGEMAKLLAEMAVLQVDGVVLDVGVSSMQLDEAQRGFSFMREGPLDMRMSKSGPSAADAVNKATIEQLEQIIRIFGEEPRARKIAKAIAAVRTDNPITTTGELVRAIERATGRQRAHERTHPATRTFQALRIHVNGELDELTAALQGAEQILRPGGVLVIVTFHSLEDRIVKHFLAERSGQVPGSSRHMPEARAPMAPSFRLPFKGCIEAGPEETARNPRARSAKLRAGIRTEAPAMPATERRH